MADPASRITLPGTGAASAASRIRLPGQAGEEDRFEAVFRSEKFRELVTQSDLLKRSQTDVSLGDPARFRSRVFDLRDDVMTEFSLTGSQLDNLVWSAMGSDPNEVRSLPETLGGNVFGAVMGLFEPLQLAGDAMRTFPAHLADVQGERVAREGGSGGRTEALSVREGTFGGAPASTPWGAARELTQAAGRTAETLLGDGGWVAYTPSLTWRGNRIWGETPYEAGRAVRGTEFNERFGINARLEELNETYGIYERLGLEDEEAREWAGLATEVLADPWLWADWMFIGARAASAFGKAAGSDRLLGQAARMEGAAMDMYRTLSPVGLGRAAVSAIDQLPYSPASAALRAAERGVNWVLDVEWPAMFNRPGTDVAAQTLGFPDGPLRPKLRDLLGQHGVFEGLARPFGRPAFITGSEAAGVGAIDQAAGLRRQLQGITMRGASELSDALTTGLTQRRDIRLGGMRIVIPGAHVVPENLHGYVRGVGQLVSEFIDTVGVTGARAGQRPARIQQRLEDLSSLYGIPIEDSIARFNAAANVTRQTVMRAGYETSGYRHFVDAMRVASNNLDIPYEDARRGYERFVGGIDLQTMEARDFFPTNPANMAGSTVPDQAALRRGQDFRKLFENDPELVRMFEDEIQAALGAAGRADLAMVAPSQYLAGMREGYLPRMFAGVEDAAGSLEALRSRAIIVTPNVPESGFANALAREFGGSDAAGLERTLDTYLNAMTPDLPRGYVVPEGQTAQYSAAFRTDDLARIIREATGTEPTPHQIANVLYGPDGARNSNFQYLMETQDIITDYTARIGQGAGQAGAPMSRPTASFSQRLDMPPEQLIARLQLFDPVQQVVEMGIRGGRAVQSMDFLGSANQGLRELGLVMDRKSLLAAADRGDKWAGGALEAMAYNASRAETGGGHVYPFTLGDGSRWVVLPENKRAWGPLAGAAVPEDVARLTVYTANHASRDTGAYGRILAMWRRGLLAPSETSLRNVIGNFFLMNQAGASIADMVQFLPEAMALRRTFQDTGRLPGEFRGNERLFNFIQSSTLGRHVSRSMEDQLLAMSRSGRNTASGLLDWAEGVNHTLTHTAPFGFLTQFKAGEEITRLSSFLTQYRALQRAGVETAEAMSRAAHFAANAGYNYGALPLLPDLLRRTGLSAFPQFTWFTVGRTLQVGGRRPAVPQRIEYARQAWNMGVMGTDVQEQERVTEMSASWLRHSQPLAIPMRMPDGQHRIANLDYILPQGANLADMLTEPMGAGWLSPMIDAVFAHAEGSGMGPYGARFGQRVFDPAGTGPERALDTARYLGSQFVLPGLWRTAEQALTSYEDANNPNLEMLQQDQGRFFNSDWAQFALRRLALGTQTVDVAAFGISHQQRRNDLSREYAAKLRSLTRAYRNAVISGDRDEQRSLTSRIIDLRKEQNDRDLELLRATRRTSR